MGGTVAGPGNAEDPAVVRQRGLKKLSARKEKRACEVPGQAAEELVDDVLDDEEAEPDDEDDEDAEEDVDADVEDGLGSEDFEPDDDEADAGALLDDEPRLSLR